MIDDSLIHDPVQDNDDIGSLASLTGLWKSEQILL